MTAGPRAPHLTAPQRLALVFAGGTVGTAVRAGLGLLAHPWLISVGGVAVPLSTLTINIVGAFLLGFLVQRLAGRRQSPPTRGSEALRLALGTGVLGGFTTYSALSIDTVLLASVDLVAAVMYSGATLLVGALASWAGIALAMRPGRHSAGEESRGPSPHPGEPA